MGNIQIKILASLLFVLAISCERHPGCNQQEVEESFDSVNEAIPSLYEVTARMRAFCQEDLAGMCYTNEDACTIGIGSALAEGRMGINDRVPTRNAIAHEALHWRQMMNHQCMEHSEECDWDPYLVEEIQKRK